ncbi:hypothetical protein C8F04DRAFT_1187513 [Mycena alexandri]|uniref:Uncharacterized protein n=1 Tax=Mycena alexandri TaxID=1745969 RepID=A0AAD6WY76_9AGAR|nr:hypothetical protein C8F04DRAFT_1187513 [Mycena alexandri]
MPFSSPFHRDGLLRTKEYIPSSLFASSVVWTRTGKEETLTQVMPGPLDPDGPAAPDAVLIVIGIVSDSNFLKLGTVGNWSSYTNDDWKKNDFSAAKYTFTILEPSLRSPKAVHQLRRAVATTSTAATALPASSPVAAVVVTANSVPSATAITAHHPDAPARRPDPRPRPY